MRILLDHCVPVDLAPHMRSHEVTTVRDMGWQKFADGELLDAASGLIDVLITVDAGLRYQQIISDRSLSVVVLRARSNRVGHLARLIPALMRALKDIAPGQVREVSE